MLNRSRGSRATRYTYPALALAVVLLMRLTVKHEITDALNAQPFLLFHIAIVFSALFVGRGAGIVATMISALSAHYFFMSPARSWHPIDVLGLATLAIFIGEGVVISLFAGVKRAAGQKLDERISDQAKELEAVHQQTMQNELLNALGTAMSKISHEMANRVHCLSATIEMLEWQKSEEHPADVQHDSLIEDLKNEMRRLANFINELRAVPRPVALNPAPVNMTDVMAELLWFHCNLGYQSVEVEQHLTPVLPPIVADRGKLQDALSKLWKNALEAMPNGGKLTVTAYEENDRVVIEIQDTGIGIPESMHVFELFTTSKENGWGLGLPVARQIILAHSGTIDYTSKPGVGTTFKITLPSASGERAHPHHAAPNAYQLCSV